MISFDQARNLAEEEVRALGVAIGLELCIDGHETIETKGWLFFYNQKEYIETRDFSLALAGNGPVFVDRNGVLRTFSSGDNWDKAIRSL
jgi:hypothetical protein